MILDVFPSYKDKDMVDLLYQFERATGSSLNILVEKYLEKVLYKEGYLNAEIGKEPALKIDGFSDSKHHFEKGKRAGESVQVYCGDLYFGYVKIENYEERIENLKQFSFDELEEISKNNWDDSFGNYSGFLKWKIKNPSLSIDSYLHESQFEIYPIRSKRTFQIKHDGFSMCSVKDNRTLEKIKKYLFDLSYEELSILKTELKNTHKNRREYILEKIGGK